MTTLILAVQGGVIPKSGGESGIPKFRLNYKSFNRLYRSFCLKSQPINGHSRFASHLALYLPEVAERIDYDDFGILHLEVGALKLATRDAIAQGDWYTVGKYFAFVADAMEDAGTELLDALRVSYLANLFYGESSINYAKARSLLPELLSMALVQAERHYEDLLP